MVITFFTREGYLGLGCSKGGGWFICVICQNKSQLSALEGETTVLWHPWPFHHAMPSHAFCIHNGLRPKHGSSTPTPAPLSPAALFVNTTDIFFSALLVYLAACCQTQTQGRLLVDNMTDSLFTVCLTHRLSFMCTSMEPSGCRLFSMSPSKLVYAPLNQIPPMLTLDFMCLYWGSGTHADIDKKAPVFLCVVWDTNRWKKH